MLNNQTRQKLQQLITSYGHSVCDDTKRCEALLRDFCPEHKRELNLLIAVLKEGIPQQLLKSTPHIAIDFTIKRLARSLHENLGTAEHFAFWAVESWALALNVIQQPIAQTQYPQSPAPKQTPTDAWLDELIAWADKNDISEDKLPRDKQAILVLTELNLICNEFTELRESIGKLTNLTCLGLSDNQFTELPEFIGKLTNLTELYLEDN